MLVNTKDFQLFLILLAISLWTLPWKGIALWKASKNNHKKWFIFILISNTLALLEILYIFIFAKRKRKDKKEIK